MRLIRRAEVHCESRPDGRTVRKLLELDLGLDMSSAVIYLCEVPGGRFGAHYHSGSTEIIWFPNGGKIQVNEQTYEMEEWDAVLLAPGDVHGFDSDGGDDIVHFAIKLPATPDKVDVP
jgi:quercetin dioxygenase-like cupin family protein